MIGPSSKPLTSDSQRVVRLEADGGHLTQVHSELGLGVDVVTAEELACCRERCSGHLIKIITWRRFNS